MNRRYSDAPWYDKVVELAVRFERIKQARSDSSPYFLFAGGLGAAVYMHSTTLAWFTLVVGGL